MFLDHPCRGREVRESEIVSQDLPTASYQADTDTYSLRISTGLTNVYPTEHISCITQVGSRFAHLVPASPRELSHLPSQQGHEDEQIAIQIESIHQS